MAPLTQTKTLDLIGSITHPKVAQKIADNVTGKIPLFFFLNRIGNKEMEDGGENYRLPVLHTLTTAQAYVGTTILTNPETDSVTSAVYERKQITVPIVATGTKLLKNSSGNVDAIIDYATSLVEIGEESMKNALAGSTIGIFSSQNESDLGVTGLRTFLTDSTTTQTVGKLSRATYSFWQHKTDSVATGFDTDGLLSMRVLHTAVTRGDEGPSIIVMTPTGYSLFLDNMVGTMTYNTPSPDTRFGDIDFQHANFHGAPVLPDDGVPSSRAYFLNLKYFKLLVHRDRDMSVRDWISPTTQDSILARLYWAGNLVCNNLARQGILQGLVDTNA